MENEVIKGRLQKLRAVMKEKKIDYYMMPTADFHNSEYVNDDFKVRQSHSHKGRLRIRKEAGREKGKVLH